MKNSHLFILLLPLYLNAHPGIAIVKDSRGTIYYSDLKQVWQIKNGLKTVAVPKVHTHELYIDRNDNLYGQHVFNTNDTTFYHYMWRLSPSGKLDTIINTQLAYQQIDFSLARDKDGNEYFTRHFLKRPDTANIYKKTPDGNETIFAKGNFRGVRWLHPQEDGSLLFVMYNNIYLATPDGKVALAASNVANQKPSFSFSEKPTLWGVWQDSAENIYAAAFSDGAVKKIRPDGQVSICHQSTAHWAPLHGVIDNEGTLWVLESSDKNEIRVVAANPSPTKNKSQAGIPTAIFFIGGAVVAIILLYRFLPTKSLPCKVLFIKHPFTLKGN